VKRSVGHEQYFTDPALAERCVAFAASLLAFEDFELFVEPSAGEAAFLRLLPEDRRIGIDLEPRDADVVRADFLQWEPPTLAGPILTIGNPPFGQRAALAMDFMARACTFSAAVAFILPRSFNKYTFQDRVDARFHLLGSVDCDGFHDKNGAKQTVKTVFQVWSLGDHDRAAVVQATTHLHFDMRHCHLSRVGADELLTLRASYAFTIPQVGSDFRPREPGQVTKGSHWFIRPRVPGVRERFERLDFGFLDGMNTAHTSLSKKDIIAAYEKVVADE
jgi:hypothetical protein